jgi:Protein of unknown function (DUF1592)/Protein of unknown function (DUF1588)/Protein of unknown function (DUF1585)
MKVMHRWQAAWPAGACALGLLLGACGGSNPRSDGAAVDATSDPSPAPETRDAVSSLDGRDVAPASFDLAPADGPGDTAAADLATSGCLVLAAEPAASEAPAPMLPGRPTPPMPPTTGDPGKLTPQEIVGRLSRFIWQMEPDAALLARVEGCARLTVTDVLVLADLMLHDPRATRSIQAFVSWWLELDRLPAEQRDPASFPPFTDELRRSMAEEVRLFAAHVVFNDTGTLRRLLTAPYSFVDRHLAAIYDVPPIDDSFRRIDFRPTDERAGILTLPGVLAVSGGFDRHSGPVRGKRLLERVLCFEVPPPPAMLTPEIPPPSARPGQSLRQAMEQTLADPVCQGCHALLEVGFVFEPFDAIGRRRTTDNGAPIDAHAQLRGVDGEDLAASGPVSLVQKLADLDSTQRCFARRWLEFAVGRDVVDGDQFVVGALTAAIRRGLDIRALIAQVTITVPFLAPN